MRRAYTVAMAMFLALVLLVGCQTAKDPYEEMTDLLRAMVGVERGEMTMGLRVADDEASLDIRAAGLVDGGSGNFALDIGMVGSGEIEDLNISVGVSTVDDSVYVDLGPILDLFAQETGQELESGMPPLEIPVTEGEPGEENPYAEELDRILGEIGEAAGDALRDREAVTGEDGVYTMTLDAGALRALLGAVLDQVEENLEDYADVLTDYLLYFLEELADSMAALDERLGGQDLFNVEYSIDEDFDLEESREAIAESRAALEDLDSDLSLVLTVSERDDTYSLDLSLIDDDMAITLYYTIREAEVEITAPEESLPLDEFADELGALIGSLIGETLLELVDVEVTHPLDWDLTDLEIFDTEIISRADDSPLTVPVLTEEGYLMLPGRHVSGVDGMAVYNYVEELNGSSLAEYTAYLAWQIETVFEGQDLTGPTVAYSEDGLSSYLATSFPYLNEAGLDSTYYLSIWSGVLEDTDEVYSFEIDVDYALLGDSGLGALAELYRLTGIQIARPAAATV